MRGSPDTGRVFSIPNADYFNLSGKDTRIATAHREQRSPTLAQVKHVIQAMPADSEIERRNRALVAFALMTGARDSAIASMKLKHVDLAARSVFQDARDIKTKFAKSFTTFFFPVGEEVASIFLEWMNFCFTKSYGVATIRCFRQLPSLPGESQRFEVIGLDRKHWSNATPIRMIFRHAFEGAGLPYFNPHSIRKTLARLGEQSCTTPEAFKAWSQNLGHEKVLTTLLNYGSVAADRQGAIIRGLSAARQTNQPAAEEIAEAVFRMLKSSGAGCPAAL